MAITAPGRGVDFDSRHGNNPVMTARRAQI
jgi:hypothetical protein